MDPSASMSFPIRSKAQGVLDALHAAAEHDAGRWKERSGNEVTAQNAAGSGDLVRLGNFFLAVTPQEGRFLYLLARATKARQIVEFGASFGVSSIYLASAARDNGGHLTTTEVHPQKCAALRETFEAAGLVEVITLLEGDARETLKAVSGPVDLLFLDGWKGGYLPVFELMRPKLAGGSLVLADNCHHAAAQDYLAAVTDDASGFVTEIRGDMAISSLAS